MPVALFTCPTRRKLQAFPRANRGDYVNINDPFPIIGRCDYAANSGSTYANVQPGAPNSGYGPNFDWSQMVGTVNSDMTKGYMPATGVIYRAE